MKNRRILNIQSDIMYIYIHIFLICFLIKAKRCLCASAVKFLRTSRSSVAKPGTITFQSRSKFGTKKKEANYEYIYL